MRPMLATRGLVPPTDHSWVHEVKWDGVRAIVTVTPDGNRVQSRSERDITAGFPELAGLESLPQGLVLDGELIVVDEGGNHRFEAVVDRVHLHAGKKAPQAAAGRSPATLMVFDVLACEGQSTIGLPLHGRRQLLEVLELDQVGGTIGISPWFDDPDALLTAVRDQGFEGMMSKRLDSVYSPGKRSEDWLKFPLRSMDSFVVGGYRLEPARHRIGALLIGEPTERGLEFRGRVGLATSAEAERILHESLDRLRLVDQPFVDLPSQEKVGVEWVEPAIVIDVEYLERTGDARLRHPTYRGPRPDLSISDLLMAHKSMNQGSHPDGRA